MHARLQYHTIHIYAPLSSATGSSCSLANTYARARTHTRHSTLRQVPDNQEVYIDKDGFTSIIFDITERVGGPGTSAEIDGRALTTHLEELVGDELDTVTVWNTTPTQFSRLEYVLLFFLPSFLPFFLSFLSHPTMPSPPV